MVRETIQNNKTHLIQQLPAAKVSGAHTHCNHVRQECMYSNKEISVRELGRHMDFNSTLRFKSVKDLLSRKCLVKRYSRNMNLDSCFLVRLNTVSK